MELYHNNMSVCAQKVRLVIAAKDLKPTEHHLNLRANDQLDPAYLKLNPNGVVPTLVDGGKPIIESTVICAYLEDAYPEHALAPSDPVERAFMRLWMMRPDTGLHPACGMVSVGIAFREQMLAMPKAMIAEILAARAKKSPNDPIGQIIEHGVDAPVFAPSIRYYRTALVAMDDRLQSADWLVGDRYSLADITMLPYVCRLEDLALSWMWDGMPKIAGWLERAKAQPSYRGIGDYLDPKYLDIMGRNGREHRAKIEAALA